MPILDLMLTQAKKHNERAYLQAKCKVGAEKKWKLLVEITKKQTADYLTKMKTIMREGERRVKHGTTFLALKEWAKGKKRELVG